MKKVVIFGIISMCVILAGGLVFNIYFKPTSTQTVISQDIKNLKNIKTLNFEKLEIADTSKLRTVGLMNRTVLCKSCGMLFVFENSQVLDFWMKNTLIPLDMIFVDEQNTVVKIHQNTIPLQTTPTYSSEIKSKYVIETNAYFTKENNINVGDLIDMPKLLDNRSL